MDTKNNYLVVLTIVTGLMGLYFLFSIKVLLPIAFIIAVISLFSSYLTEKIAWVWDKIALLLGTINSKILLTLIFYLILVPIALISRLFKKKDPLMLLKKPEDSYFRDRNFTFGKGDLENVF